LSSSLIEIEEKWSMCDVYDAHETLNLYEDLEAMAARKR
jgi:hypothetical protein